MVILWQDIRFALRRLVRSFRFSLAVLATLAVAVAANIIIYSVVDAVLLRPLPLPQSERLVALQGARWEQGAGGALEVENWVAENRTLEAVALYNSGTLSLTGDSAQESIRATQVSSGFFVATGMSPLYGSVPTSRERELWRRPVVVISHTLWRRRFDSDPAILEKVLRLNGRAYEVAAIMPVDFDFPERTELWVPARLNPPLFFGDLTYLEFGRLAEGLSLEQAQAKMDIGTNHHFDGNPGARRRDIRLKPLHGELVGSTRPPLLALQAAAAFVLLIAFVNLANLQIARAASRRGELTIRAALGAGSSALVRQPLTEYLLLTFFGWLAGLVVARWGLAVLLNQIPRETTNYDQIALSPRVAFVSLTTVLAASLVLGLLPGLKALRWRSPENLKGSRSMNDSIDRRNRLSSGLAVTQVALALVLLIGAGLLLTSFGRLLRVDLGFEPSPAVVFDVPLVGERYYDPDRTDFDFEKVRADFMREALERVRALPYVTSAGATTNLPLGGMVDPECELFIEGWPSNEEEPRTASYRIASPGYFPSVGIPLLVGRDFNERDGPVVIVNEELAEGLWRAQNPIGKRLKPAWNQSGPWLEIVGVVGNARHSGPESEPRMELYLPYQEEPWMSVSIVVGTRGDPLATIPGIREQLHAVDPDLPLHRVTTMADVYDASFSERRALMVVVGVFASGALLLAVLGVYSLMSYVVSLRTQEYGIHMAVGAQPADVLRRVLQEAFIWLLMGVVLGWVLSLAMTRFLSGFLFDLAPTDPTTFAAVSVIIVVVGLTAAYLPARRASHVDPMVALRHE